MKNRKQFILILPILFSFATLYCQNNSIKKTKFDSVSYITINELFNLLQKDTIRTLEIDSSNWNIILGKKYFGKKLTSVYNFEDVFYNYIDHAIDSCNKDDLCIIKLFGYTFDRLFEIGIDFDIQNKINSSNVRHVLGSKFDIENRKLSILNYLINLYLKNTHDKRSTFKFQTEIETYIKYSSLSYPKLVESKLNVN